VSAVLGNAELLASGAQFAKSLGADEVPARVMAVPHIS